MNYIKISPKDNVAVALEDLKTDTVVLGVTLLCDIPAGHKFALDDISKGESVIKYGSPIGHATEDIEKGTWVHTHNTKTNLDGILEYKYEPVSIDPKEGRVSVFKGFRRETVRWVYEMKYGSFRLSDASILRLRYLPQKARSFCMAQ